MLTKRNIKLVITLFIVASYGISIASLKGKLPNQTATLITVNDSEIRSLIPKNLTYVNLSLKREEWEISGENATARNSNGKLIFSGVCTTGTSPMFTAKNTKYELNFTENPYFHVIVSSNPSAWINFHIGWLSTNSTVIDEFLHEQPELVTEIDEIAGIIWINISYSQAGQINDESHHVTVNVGQVLMELGLEKQRFVGVQIRQYPTEFMSSAAFFETIVESLCLLKELPYQIASTEAGGQTLPDGSIVHIVEKKDVANDFQGYPYVERAYLLYTTNASADSLYIIFFLIKQGENLTSAKSSFVFVHTGRLSEIGTHVDWRRTLQMNHDFEPLATLYSVMNNGDYAIIFTPLKGSKLQSVQLRKAEFTFSKIPYSSMVIGNLSESVLSVMSIFIISIAGILPMVLVCALFYLHKTNRLEDDKITVIALVVAGLGIRLILAPISAFADDLQIFSQLGALYFGSGVFGAQWVSLPGFVYIETATYFPYALLRACGFQDFQFLALSVYSVEALFTKIPSILSDLGSFYFILRIARKHLPKEKMLVSGIFLLSPITIYISGILGQFDSIFAFFVIAGIYYLIGNYNNFKATVCASLAAVLNPVGLAMFIPVLANVGLKENWRAVAKSLLLATVILGLLMLPCFLETRSPMLLASYERLINAVPGETFYGREIIFCAYGRCMSVLVGYGLTFRFLLALVGIDLGPIFYPFGAALLFLTFAGAFVYKIRKAHMTGSSSVVYAATFMLVIASMFQLTFPTVFDQFVIWVAGLLLVSYVLCQNRTLLSMFILISIATGFIYVAAWRSYLLLVSGVETVPFGNRLIAGAISVAVGTLYSISLLIILVTTFKMWIQNAKPSES